MKITILAMLSTLFYFLFQKEIPAQTLQIIFEDPALQYNNHVGNEWGFGVETNGIIYSIKDTILIPLSGKSKSRVFVQEIDKYTEEVSQWLEIDASSLESGKTYTKNMEFVIRENMGRYAGNTAKWVIKLKYQKLVGRA